MTQTPSNDYPAPGSPYSEPVDPYATPVQSYDAPVDPYAAPADPYAVPAETYAAPAEPYTTLDDTYANAPIGTGEAAKDEAANVKGTAQDEAANVKGTAQDEAANVKETAKGEAAAVTGTAKEEAAAVTGTAKEEATAVKDTAVGAGQQVASVATDEAKNVAAETATQVKDVAKLAAGEATSQLNQGKAQVATLVHSYAKQLGSMASATDESGPLTDLAKRASATVGDVGHWLEDREPRELVSDLSDFARRRPAVFLVGAALAGVVAGRLTRGLIAEAKDKAAPATDYSSPAYATDGATTGYDQPVPSATYVDEAPVQGGRYGDLASDPQVVGYGVDGSPSVTGYQGNVVR